MSATYYPIFEADHVVTMVMHNIISSTCMRMLRRSSPGVPFLRHFNGDIPEGTFSPLYLLSCSKRRFAIAKLRYQIDRLFIDEPTLDHRASSHHATIGDYTAYDASSFIFSSDRLMFMNLDEALQSIDSAHVRSIVEAALPCATNSRVHRRIQLLITLLIPSAPSLTLEHLPSPDLTSEIVCATSDYSTAYHGRAVLTLVPMILSYSRRPFRDIFASCGYPEMDVLAEIIDGNFIRNVSFCHGRGSSMELPWFRRQSCYRGTHFYGRRDRSWTVDGVGYCSTHRLPSIHAAEMIPTQSIQRSAAFGEIKLLTLSTIQRFDDAGSSSVKIIYSRWLSNPESWMPVMNLLTHRTRPIANRMALLVRHNPDAPEEVMHEEWSGDTDRHDDQDPSCDDDSSHSDDDMLNEQDRFLASLDR
jgi:hypothetical protein